MRKNHSSISLARYERTWEHMQGDENNKRKMESIYQAVNAGFLFLNTNFITFELFPFSHEPFWRYAALIIFSLSFPSLPWDLISSDEIESWNVSKLFLCALFVSYILCLDYACHPLDRVHVSNIIIISCQPAASKLAMTRESNSIEVSLRFFGFSSNRRDEKRREWSNLRVRIISLSISLFLHERL